MLRSRSRNETVGLSGRRWALGVVTALGLTGVAEAQMVTGMFRWTDAQGVTHPLRQHLVDVYHGPLAPGTPPGHLARVYTGLNGVYTATYDVTGPYPFVFAHAFSDTGITPGGGGGFVFMPGMLPTRPPITAYTDAPREGIYHWGSGVGGTGGVINYTFPLDSIPPSATVRTRNRAMSVSDALFTGWYYSSQVRGAAGGAAEIPVNFPATSTHYCPVGIPPDADCPRPMEIHLLNEDAFDWDVILHEYGHYLADIDNMARGAPGGRHAAGVSNITGNGADIPARGKLNGMRLAWSEGLATYLGIAAQHVNPADQNLPGTAGNPTMANVGDTRYQDTEDAAINWDLETLDLNGAVNRGQGEGDELPVARILWDLADPANEPYDRISHGHVSLYNILNNNIAALETSETARIDSVWNHFFNLPSITDAVRKDYGAIFEEHGISPHPVGGPIDMTLDPAGPAPTFTWERRNNNENDTFQLLIFNSDLSMRVLDIMVPGDVTMYTLTAGDWASLAPQVPTIYRFVVAGSDTSPRGGAGAWFTTGRYWSDAYSFTVIPSPGALVLLAGVTVLGACRRQVRQGGGGTLGA